MKKSKPSNASLAPEKVLFRIALALVIVAACAARMIASQRSGLWYDEYYSAVFATAESLGRTLEAIETIDFHPPGYYLQLRPWAMLSASEPWLLTNSLAWSAVALVGTFLCGDKLSGRWGGLLALALFGVSALAVKEASELRMYSMLMALAAMSLWGLLQQVTATSPVKWAVFTTCCSVAISWSHGAGPLWIAFLGATTAALLLGKVGTRSGRVSLFATVLVTVVATIPVVLRAMARRPGHLASSSGAEWGEILGALVPGFRLVPVVAVIFVVGLLALVARAKVPRSGLLLCTVGGTIATGVALYGLGFFAPVVHLRSVAMMCPVVAVVLGALVAAALAQASTWSRWGAASALLVFLAASCVEVAPTLVNPERSQANRLLATKVEKRLARAAGVWAPRVGTAYSLCWELAGPGSVVDPTSPHACELRDVRAVYTGSRRPAALDTPYLLVLRKGERIPRIAASERLGKLTSVSGHRVAVVKARPSHFLESP